MPAIACLPACHATQDPLQSADYHLNSAFNSLDSVFVAPVLKPVSEFTCGASEYWDGVYKRHNDNNKPGSPKLLHSPKTQPHYC